MTNAETILQRGIAVGVRITAAESCTGGMIAAALTDVAGSSAIFEQGFVTYSNLAKQNMLGVPADLLESYGAVSEAVVTAMADGARQAAKADIAIAVSGIAGPGGSDFKPEGRVCFACVGPAFRQVETVEFGALGRSQVRAKARDHALKLILAAIPAP